MQIIGLLTTYQDADWLPDTLATLALLDGSIIVEGAYQETIALGKPPRSPDNTLDLCRDFCSSGGNRYLYEVNESSDIQQRNFALERIKEHFGHQDIVVFIVDGDESYQSAQIEEIWQWSQWMNNPSKTYSGLIWSKTYLAEKQYTPMIFPRLFLLTSGCKFIDSNLMYWPEVNYTQVHSDREDKRSKILPFRLAATHRSYTRDLERFEWKKAGRINRRGSFPWNIDSNQQVIRTDGKQIIIVEE